MSRQQLRLLQLFVVGYLWNSSVAAFFVGNHHLRAPQRIHIISLRLNAAARPEDDLSRGDARGAAVRRTRRSVGIAGIVPNIETHGLEGRTLPNSK
jgi:hypothetical protein